MDFVVVLTGYVECAVSLRTILNSKDFGSVTVGVAQAGLGKPEPPCSLPSSPPPPNLGCILQQMLFVTIRIRAY